MKNNFNFLIFITIGVLLGFLIIQQFYLQKKITQSSQPENISDLAFQVLQLNKSNEDLKKEIGELSEQKDMIEKSLFDRNTATQTLDKDLAKYKIISGQVEISGPGVQIKIDRKMKLEQMVDLLNAIRNIGAEAISINGKRISYSKGISEKDFSPPYKIEVIGNSDLLYSALSRRGGILDEVAQGEVLKKEMLILPAVQ